MKNLSKVKGFTLVELLIVIAIIGFISVTSLQAYVQNLEDELSESAAVKIVSLTHKSALRAASTNQLLAVGGYSDLRQFKFDNCAGTNENGIPNGVFGALLRANFTGNERFLSCGTPLNSLGIQLSDKPNLPAFFERYLNQDISVVDTANEPAIEFGAGLLKLNFSMDQFVNKVSSTRKMMKFINALVTNFEEKGYSVPNDVQIFPRTLVEAHSLLAQHEKTGRDVFLEVTIDTNSDFDSRNITLAEGDEICWDVSPSEQACVGASLDSVSDNVKFALSSTNNARNVDSQLQGAGKFLEENDSLAVNSNVRIHSVTGGDTISKPNCPLPLSPRIASAVSGVTDAQLPAPANNWGDEFDSNPDYGTSSIVGVVGVGWETVGNDWKISTNIASANHPNGSDNSMTRVIVFTWCGDGA